MRKTNVKRAALIATLMGAALLCAVPVSLHQSRDSGLSVSLDRAEARVGNPGSAVSVAGVNRRHRRSARRCATGVTC